LTSLKPQTTILTISTLTDKIPPAVLSIILITALLTVNFVLGKEISASETEIPQKLLGGPAEPRIVDGSAFMNPLNSTPNLTSSTADFAAPTTGWNWGQLHPYNAVDIANSCGTPVYAAAEGIVKQSVTNGWNEGYGNYLIVEHANNAETVYGHLDKIFAPAGKYLLKGDLIAEMGNTGNTDGPTGCHLHFEVHGAKNPLAK